jgi:hypothetical protein
MTFVAAVVLAAAARCASVGGPGGATELVLLSPPQAARTSAEIDVSVTILRCLRTFFPLPGR